MLNNSLYILGLLLGIVFGYILTKLCSDELKNWRKRLLLIGSIAILGIVLLVFSTIDLKIPLILALAFIIVTVLTIIFQKKR